MINKITHAVLIVIAVLLGGLLLGLLSLNITVAMLNLIFK